MDRLRALFRTHGWSALVIYLLLSALDFTLCFFVIYAIGADRVREAEDYVLEKLEWKRRDGEMGRVKRAVVGWKEGGKLSDGEVKERKEEEVAHRREKAVQETKQGAGSAIATTAVLAYAVHKVLLLPFRLGATVWITPKAVRVLQSWGWKVGMNTKGVEGAIKVKKSSLKAAQMTSKAS